MTRRSRQLDLTLLLLVAPFFAACDRTGPEERRCVDGHGVYVDDERCDPQHGRYAPGSHYVYVPRNYYTGVGSPAGRFSSATTAGSGHAMVSRGGFGSIGAGHGTGG